MHLSRVVCVCGRREGERYLGEKEASLSLGSLVLHSGTAERGSWHHWFAVRV